MLSKEQLSKLYKKKAALRTALKGKIYRKQKFKCFFCKVIVKRPCLGNIDHFMPLSKGGTSNENNLVFSCLECNSKKADQLPHEFIKLAS